MRNPAFTVLLFFFLISSAAAAAPAALSFQLEDGTKVSMTELEGGRLLLSTSCVRDAKPGECLAWEHAKKSVAAAVHPKDGAEPGAIVCAQSGGKVRIARDGKRNEESFCEFPDSSLISCGSLYAIAVRNRLDGLKKK